MTRTMKSFYPHPRKFPLEPAPAPPAGNAVNRR